MLDFSKFKPMKPPGGQLNIDDVKYPVWASIKYDGYRVAIHSGRTWLNSLREVDNEHTRNVLTRNSGILDLYDGELTVGDLHDPKCFNNCQSAFSSYEGEPDFTFWVFDRIHHLSYEDRFLSYEHRPLHYLPFVKVVEQTLISDREQLDRYVEKVLAAGHEGVMLRGKYSKYKFGRATFKTQEILRIKPLETGEATVIGFECEYENTNPRELDNHGNTKRSSHAAGRVAKDTLGKLVCADPNFGEIKLNGFTDALADEIWRNKDKYIGKLAHYTYQAHGTTDKPRILKFKGFRDAGDMTK